VKKAWRLTHCGTTGIMAAHTRGQAIFRLFHELKDLGSKPRLRDIKCRRAHEHDEWAEVDESRACWDERYLPCK